MAQVKAVPQGYTTVTTVLNIKGAAEAMEFYKKALGAEQRGGVMKGPDGTVMHAEMQLGSSVIMMTEAQQVPATNSSMFLYVDDCDALWKRATSAGMSVEVPIADMFWGDRWGVLSDKFGNRWGIASHKEDVPEAEMGKRMAAAMKNMKP